MLTDLFLVLMVLSCLEASFALLTGSVLGISTSRYAMRWSKFYRYERLYWRRGWTPFIVVRRRG